jgi:hypothetical protein
MKRYVYVIVHTIPEMGGNVEAVFTDKDLAILAITSSLPRDAYIKVSEDKWENDCDHALIIQEWELQ